MSADLAQRLRDYPSYEECLQAADRIEALETRWDLQVYNAVRMAAERISQLEAALRDIADTKDSKDLGMDEPDTHDDQNMIDTLIWIARRALECKP